MPVSVPPITKNVILPQLSLCAILQPMANGRAAAIRANAQATRNSVSVTVARSAAFDAKELTTEDSKVPLVNAKPVVITTKHAAAAVTPDK